MLGAYKKKGIIFWIINFIFLSAAFSEKYSSVRYNHLNNNQVSFWHKSNQFGLSDNPYRFEFYSSLGTKIKYGMSIWAKKNKVKIPVGYFKYKLNKTYFSFGRWSQKISTESFLSSGSMIKSKNAILLPQISIYNDMFTELKQIPFGLWYKWGVSHGKFSKSSYINPPLLHEKYLYIKKPFENNSFISVGIIHEVMWGGETVNHGKQPNSIIDYLRVVTAQPASSLAIEQERINVLGNHLGIWDISVYKELESLKLKLYFQHPFEDKSSMYQYFFDELKNFNFPSRSFDGLFGIELSRKESSTVSTLLYEYLNTMHQSGSKAASDSTYGWDNYYNHYIYQSGWTNDGDIIGTPMFTLGTNEGHYSNRTYIINNRVRAHHVGLSGKLTSLIRYKSVLTFSKNYGTYFDAEKFKSIKKRYPFEGGLRQVSGLIQFEIKLKKVPINGKLSYAFDRGELFPNSDSFLFSISYYFGDLSASN